MTRLDPGTRTPHSVLLALPAPPHGSHDTLTRYQAWLGHRDAPHTYWPSGSLCAHCLCQLRLQRKASLTILCKCPHKVLLGGVPHMDPDASQCNWKREAGRRILQVLAFLQRWDSTHLGLFLGILKALFSSSEALFSSLQRIRPIQESLSPFMDEEVTMKHGAFPTMRTPILWGLWLWCSGGPGLFVSILSTAQEPTPTSMRAQETAGLHFVQSVTFLPASWFLRHHSAGILLANTPNIQEEQFLSHAGSK